MQNSVTLASGECTHLEFLAREAKDGPVALGRAELHPVSLSPLTASITGKNSGIIHKSHVELIVLQCSLEIRFVDGRF